MGVAPLERRMTSTASSSRDGMGLGQTTALTIAAPAKAQPLQLVPQKGIVFADIIDNKTVITNVLTQD